MYFNKNNKLIILILLLQKLLCNIIPLLKELLKKYLYPINSPTIFLICLSSLYFDYNSYVLYVYIKGVFLLLIYLSRI